MNKSDGYWLDCDFLYGASFSFENAKKHLNYSDIAGDKKDYGIAVSHIVLGIDELIKAPILVCLHGDMHFIDNKAKNNIFKLHSFKHFNIEEFLDSLTPELLQDYEDNALHYIFKENHINKFQAIASFFSKCLNLGVITDEELDKLKFLLKNANEVKNRGFYVDYVENWILPEDITKTQYSEYKELSSKLYTFISPVFEYPLSDDRIMDFLMEG